MRTGLTLTKREQRQIERALKRLEEGYAAGRLNKLIYDHKKAQLLSNLQRPKAAQTNINANQKGFFQTRRDMQTGPAPVGYWDRNNASPSRKVDMNKVRASLLSISENQWWNDGFQEALQQSANARNVNNSENTTQQNNATGQFFPNVVMHANQLSGITANTFQDTEIWNEIQKSPVVKRALEKLASQVEYQVMRMMKMGMSEKYARESIRRAAMTAGAAMTEAGYSTDRATEIVKMVVRGELTVQGAINQIASDLNQVNQAVAAINNNTQATQQYQPSWQNDYDIFNQGTKSHSLDQLMNWRNNLKNELQLENDSNKRNEIAQAIADIDAQIEKRAQGISSIQENLQTGPPGQSPGPNASAGGYDPQQNYGADASTMQQTIAALSRGGPDLWTIVDDILTIDGNLYFDYIAGNKIEVTTNGTWKEANNSSPPEQVFPKGNFTVFAVGRTSIPKLNLMVTHISNALNSEYISEADKGYLRYLQAMIKERILVAAQMVSITPVNGYDMGVNMGVNNFDPSASRQMMVDNYIQEIRDYAARNNFIILPAGEAWIQQCKTEYISGTATGTIANMQNFQNKITAKFYNGQGIYWQNATGVLTPEQLNERKMWNNPITTNYSNGQSSAQEQAQQNATNNQQNGTNTQSVANQVANQQDQSIQPETEPVWAYGRWAAGNHPYMGPNGESILHYMDNQKSIKAKSEGQHEYLHSKNATHNPPPLTENNIREAYREQSHQHYHQSQPFSIVPDSDETHQKLHNDGWSNNAVVPQGLVKQNQNIAKLSLNNVRPVINPGGSAIIPADALISNGAVIGNLNTMRMMKSGFVPNMMPGGALTSTNNPKAAQQLEKQLQKKLPAFKSASLRGSTSTTTSSRAHGGARFVNGNDPRMAHRRW